MQDIKFKAYVPELRKTVDVFAVNPMNQTVYLSSVHIFGTPGDDVLMKYGDEPDQVKLCRYTGLKDKNVVEIYEGDILRYLAPDDLERDSPITASISWHTDGGYWSIDDNEDTLGNVLDWYNGVEVVGNIYENPDLLTNAA